MSTAAIVLGILAVMLIGPACSGGLTEQEVRQIVQEHSVPGPKPESTEGVGRVSVLKRQEGAPLNLG